VLAVAIHGKATVIVTSNQRDFPADALSPHKLATITPDRFILRLLEAEAHLVLAALEADRADLRDPPLSCEQYFAMLERSGLVESTATLRVLYANLSE
jgi:hypothetical protein